MTPTTPRRITLLGATGSIGDSTLEIVDRHPDRFTVVGLAAGANVDKAEQLVARYRPHTIAMGNPDAAKQLKDRLGSGDTRVLSGPDGVAEVAALSVDLVICGIVGAAGLGSTFAAVEAGNTIALANKESMVLAGALLVESAHKHQARILPIDSEHSAIFQCLQSSRPGDLDHIILTASGGPFRTTAKADLERVTTAQASRHPNWDMGAKITVDSATMMNKGLEVIEARWLFDLPVEQIKVLVHPQSIVHSMVVFKDGAVLAQLGVPSMQPPIAYAMAYPHRIDLAVPPPDFARLATLSFEAPDTDRFPCLALAFEAIRVGGSLPAVLNAANEIAVAAFLDERIGFMDIPRTIETILAAHTPRCDATLDDLLQIDQWARTRAGETVQQLAC